MHVEKRVLELIKVSDHIRRFLAKNGENFDENDVEFENILRKSEIENPWFTQENQKLALEQWVSVLNEQHIKQWLSQYTENKIQKKIGLILAGNIPLVGFHDVISVILSNHIPLIKLSSKDRLLIPFLLKKWKEFSDGELQYETVEKLENFDAVIATGSNNTARYLEYYFKKSPSVIRKNRTSAAVISGAESDEELQRLAKDIFQYYGLGCRNVTRLFIPENFAIDRLFENFFHYKEIINHNKYANNYDYNRAVYLLNQDTFWDNNFVMLKEDDKLFSPLSVINFSRYRNLDEVKKIIEENAGSIQCIVSQVEGFENSVKFGDSQHPQLDTYADNIDTMEFLSKIV